LVYGLHYNRASGVPHRLARNTIVTQTATSPQRKPLLDEASFQQLLSAAYVLQEHNDRLRAKGHQADFAENLSAIVETQKLIQTLQLDLAAAAELVAERVQKITHASGTAIGIIEKDQLFYRSATGTAALEAGTHVPLNSVLSADCLSNGSALNYPDVTSNLHLQADLFRSRDVKAFIAVPVYHAGQVAGVLELRFARVNSFREADLRTAELMAGLLSEAMVTAARMKWKEALASERQSMLEALERIKPQIERLGSENIAAAMPLAPAVAQPVIGPQTPAVRSPDVCSACSSDFFDESESFCGICGTARAVTPALPDVSGLDSAHKNDTPWLTPYGHENPMNGNSGTGLSQARDTVLKDKVVLATPPPDVASDPGVPAPVAQSVVELPPATPSEPDSKPDLETDSALTSPLHWTPDLFAPPDEVPGPDSLRIVPADLFPADPDPTPDAVEAANKIVPYPWDSAKKAQEWLETVKTHHGPRAEWLAQQWRRRRANFYVVVAALMLLIVISGWGTRPAGNTAGNVAPAPSQHQAPPPPQLTLFEKLLVGLGLAEAPPPPVDMGNPETQVWVDVHTALYYCPGGDLYGKTADGKFSSQRDAQQDQFRPAKGKACP
jgi:putative methionine-R-sulfoxide reductase with GAF domain